ncbi:MAG TPA: DUF4870 domain-containing protein [Anaerolinea sp.]|nr:DUF4870 domain-containing protein [Anaerolinea sp.]
MTAETMTVGYYEPTSDEKTWATLAHLSVLVNLFTGVLGPVIALVIYLSHKDKSRYVAYQALQSLLLQLIVWVGGGALIAVGWIVTSLLIVVVIGLCLVPFAILLSFLPVIAPVYGVVAAVKTSQGEDFRYWLIGDWVRGTYTG